MSADQSDFGGSSSSVLPGPRRRSWLAPVNGQLQTITAAVMGSTPRLSSTSWTIERCVCAALTSRASAALAGRVSALLITASYSAQTAAARTRAMTVHQAKNREFKSVIILWPYEVTGSPERLRRLLYNAVTRARLRALVVVQNPKRLETPPFSAPVERVAAS